MCGIYGVISGTKKTGSQVYAGLKRLEYRGYDSWGVAVVEDGQFSLKKHPGKIAQQKQPKFQPATAALGHTRWATHGRVNQVNAHPHLAKNGSFALVQNGVVENYQQLKESLLKRQYEFVSETDTEVIVGLIEEEMAQKSESEPSVTTIRHIFQQLAGRNTIAILTKSGNLIAIRDGSPLVVGKNGDELLISSDVVSLAAEATHYLPINHGQGVVLTADEAVFFEAKSGKLLSLRFKKIDLAAAKLDKAGHDHFMLKEILEQSQVLSRVLEQDLKLWKRLISQLKKAGHVYTIGAGSASFAAESLAFFLRQAEIDAVAVPAYEASSYRHLWSEDDLVVAFSQSGETADTNEAVEWAKEKGVKIASIVNMPGSTLTAISDLPFMLQVGPEVGVASTKAFTGHLLWGWAVSEAVRGQKLSQLKKKATLFESKLDKWFKVALPQIKKLAKKLNQHQRLFILGRGQLYASSKEFALKMKEISYIHAEAFSGGELKHGVIALIEQGTPVINLVADDGQQAEMINAAAEVKARGAWTIGISHQENELFDEWLPLPDVELAFIAAVIPSQLLSYYMAIEKGYDPDKPRNLAKSVTVK